MRLELGGVEDGRGRIALRGEGIGVGWRQAGRGGRDVTEEAMGLALVRS